MSNGRLALYLPSLEGGGAERVMVVLANAFSALGHRVDLVLASAKGPYLGNVSGSVRIVDLGAKRMITSLLPLARYLRKERPDSLLSFLNHANVVAVAARWISGAETRVFVSERNSLISFKRRGKGSRGKVLITLMRWSYRRADGVIAISRGVRGEVCATLGIDRDSVSTIYNPIDLESLGTLGNDGPAHRWFSQKPQIILAAGRLTEQKDFPTLLRAFSRLRRSTPARLIILGEGKLRQELETLSTELGVREYVEMPGFVENAAAWMRAASVFVLSSAWEGFGNVLLEAMALGTPVVSTDCPWGPAEILENGRWGRLVPVGDDEALCAAIRATLVETERPPVQERAKDFSVEGAVQKYLNLLLPEISPQYDGEGTAP